MEFHVDSAEAALEKCWQLVRDGQADLFRGQTRDWPKLIPSLLRVSREDRATALRELDSFKEWARNIPQMATYDGNDRSITAIAQHYGLPTTYLDLTTNPEVAALFAKRAGDSEETSDAVIYCFLEAGLKSLGGARLTRINVDNLWRLETQNGLFLQFLDERLTETLRPQAIRILFPASTLSASERTRLYPIRKSALESVIDQWIYRRQVEGVTDFVTSFPGVQYVSMTHRETYPGAFRWRAVPELETSWIGYETAWIVPPVESVSVVNDPAFVTLTAVDFSDPAEAKRTLVEAIEGPIHQHRATGQLISFETPLSPDKSHLSGSVATIINRCWDGLRVLPYQADELIASIALVAALLIARAEGVEGVDDWQERLFGKLKTIEVAPIGGHIEAGAVSSADLKNALSTAHYGKLTHYMRRKASADPESLMIYVVDHWVLFDFDLFRKLFVEQFIPSAVDAFWKEDLASHEGALGCMWSINFNPALLGYVTPFEFRFLSPITTEKSCEPIVYVLPDMDRSDLEELFTSCMPTIEGGGPPFQVKFHGYASDARAIWEIERVIEQCKWIVEVGGISPLEVFPSLMPKSCEEQGRPAVGIGAFEIWLIAHGKLHCVQGKNFDEFRPLFDEFYSELGISNANLGTRAKCARDWPGPITRPDTKSGLVI